MGTAIHFRLEYFLSTLDSQNTHPASELFSGTVDLLINVRLSAFKNTVGFF